MKSKVSLVSPEPAIGPVMKQLNTMQIPKSYFSVIHFENIFPPTPMLPKWSFPCRFSG